MSSVNTIGATTGLAGQNNTMRQTLNSQDFLKIMLTELTNQDPFEPLSNKDLVDQIASIQQLESSQAMSDQFSELANKFTGTLDKFDGMIWREQLNSAHQMIGQIISGNTIDGAQTIGKVVAVNMMGNEVYLELDTGELVSMNSLVRLGGSNSNDIVGSLIMGTTETGQEVIGVVNSIDIIGDKVMLRLESGEVVPLGKASIINKDTATFLIGQHVEGKITDTNGDSKAVSGVVEGVRFGRDDEVTLLLKDGTELPLLGLTKITNNTN